jgi:hypothetical protein
MSDIHIETHKPIFQAMQETNAKLAVYTPHKNMNLSSFANSHTYTSRAGLSNYPNK